MKIASLLFIPALLLSGLTARAGLPASFKERLAEASRENRTIQCDFTQRKQVRRMNNEIELKGRFYYDNSLAMALDYTVPEGDKVIIRNDRIILKTAGQVTQTATSANPMLQQVALMIRASMTGDLSQFGQGWQICYTEKEGRSFSSSSLCSTPLCARAKRVWPDTPGKGWLFGLNVPSPCVVIRVCPITAVVWSGTSHVISWAGLGRL